MLSLNKKIFIVVGLAFFALPAYGAVSSSNSNDNLTASYYLLNDFFLKNLLNLLLTFIMLWVAVGFIRSQIK